MANHITNSQIQTLLAVGTVGALTVGQLGQLVDALDRVSFTRVTDGNAGTSQDTTLATIFPSAGSNP